MSDLARPLLICFLAVFLAGCPTSADETHVVEVCTKTGVQCRIDGTKLGVCMMAADGGFTCASQH